MSNIQDFTQRYYKEHKNLTLKLDSGGDLPTGEFDRYSMGISFSGIDQIFLDKARKVLKIIEEDSLDVDISEKLPTDKLVSRYPELVNLFLGQEVQTHEYFHLLQTLTLPSCFSLYKASRELASLKVTIFVYYLRLGGKLNLNSINNIFDVIDTVDDAEIKGYLERLFDLYRENISLIENFYEYDEGNSAINVVDLMEGAAYTFQKLMNRSTEIDTFTAKDDSFYKKAKSFFQGKGGSEDVLFLILSHMSLKYGLLDDGDFMEFMPTPQGIFEGLCENITEYEKSLNDIPLQISFFGTYSYADKLEKWGFNINNSELSLLKDISNIEDESLYAVGKLVSIIRMVTAHVKEIYNKKGTKFKDASMVIDEPRASTIDSNIKEHFVEYDSDLFLALLLAHNSFATEFFFKFLPKARDTTYKGLFDEDTSSMMDDNLYKLVDDVDFLLRHKVGRCCEEHGKIPYRDLINNNNENCLTTRVNSLIGVGLEGIIE